VAAAIPQVKAGKVKAIAVTTPSARAAAGCADRSRSRLSGIDADTWLALVAPRGLPADVKQNWRKPWPK
jgi:tripartite-type tricarboxylate transporter receptor subunit TctC